MLTRVSHMALMEAINDFGIRIRVPVTFVGAEPVFIEVDKDAALAILQVAFPTTEPVTLAIDKTCIAQVGGLTIEAVHVYGRWVDSSEDPVKQVLWTALEAMFDTMTDPTVNIDSLIKELAHEHEPADESHPAYGLVAWPQIAAYLQDHRALLPGGGENYAGVAAEDNDA